MVMRLEKVVPFGRSFDEYIKIFNLSEADLKTRILGVGDGPASFNAEATKLGGNVTSIDPIYQFSATEIVKRFYEVVDNIIDQVKVTPASWVWSYHKSPEDLRKNRVRALNEFARDYDKGKQEGRYRIGALPNLQFKNNEYDIALCSHFLFLYSEHYDYQFHYDSIREMLRVSKEVRIFPLLTLMLQNSQHLDRVMQEFTEMGYTVSTLRVNMNYKKVAMNCW
jgi:SAM-dependent methyltransferase